MSAGEAAGRVCIAMRLDGRFVYICVKLVDSDGLFGVPDSSRAGAIYVGVDLSFDILACNDPKRFVLHVCSRGHRGWFCRPMIYILLLHSRVYCVRGRRILFSVFVSSIPNRCVQVLPLDAILLITSSVCKVKSDLSRFNQSRRWFSLKGMMAPSIVMDGW